MKGVFSFSIKCVHNLSSLTLMAILKLSQLVLPAYLHNNFWWVTRIGSNHKCATILAPFFHQVLQFFTPDSTAGVPYVIAVADHSHQTCRELRQHVSEGMYFSLLTPGSNCAVENWQTDSTDESYMI